MSHIPFPARPGFNFIAVFLLLAGTWSRLAADDTPPQPATTAWLASLPRDGHDIAALAEKINSPAAAYAFVRDQIAYEPYAGVMKGAEGALLTRGANDCDRALLLARLLSVQGIEAHVVRGRPDAAHAQRLQSRVLRSPDAVALMLASLPATPVEAPSGFDDRVLAQLFAQRTADRRRQLDDALKADLPSVSASLPRTAAPAPAATATDYIWVQAEVDGKTVNYDTGPADAVAGPAPAEVVDTWSADSLPDELYHTWHLAIVAEWLKDSRLDRQEILGQDRRTVELLRSSLRLAIVPAQDHGPNAHVPMFVQDGQSTEGTVFKFHAVTRAEMPGAGGLLGGFGGGAEPEEKPEDANGPRLARLAVEITLHSPGTPDETVRRVFLDRVELKGPRWNVISALDNDASVAGLLVQAWDLALDVGAPHPFAVLEAESAAVNALDPVRAAAVAKRRLAPDEVPASPVAPQLLHFFLASGLHRHALAGTDARAFHLRPRVALLRHGFTLADWTAPDSGRLRYEEGIDLANTPFGFAGESARRRDLAVRIGLRDTALEQYVMAGAPPFNTVSFMAAVRAAGQTLRTVNTAEQLAKLRVAPATLDVLRGEIAAGRVLLLPEQPVAVRDTHLFGWWSIDPATGYAIGKMELGGAQALIEKAQTEEKVSEWTQAYVKVMGNALKCFEDEVVKALKQDARAAVLGGEMAKTPDADTAAACLRDAICDAIKDFVSGKVSSTFAASEGKLLRDIFYNSLRKSAIDNAGKQAESGCQSALGGGKD